MRKIEINRDLLFDLYINQHLTQEECGELLGCSQGKIHDALKEFNIESRTVKDWTTSKVEIPMSSEMYEILRGALLGDGSLIINNNSRNARFSYSSKSYQHVCYVTEKFKEWAVGNGISELHRFDSRTNKTYDGFQYQSCFNKTFGDEYYKWYIDGIKHIPNDLVLTPLMCKIWYIGDGSLPTNMETNYQKLILYTNCFRKDEIADILIPQLSDFSPSLTKMGIKKNGEDACAIRICGQNIKEFIDYIGECPFQDYNYKWDVKERSWKDYSKYNEEWDCLVNQGYTHYQISKMYNVDEQTIRRHSPYKNKLIATIEQHGTLLEAITI